MTQLSINYAKVLYELPVPKEDVLQSETILKQVPELLSVFTSPVIPEKKKFVLIDRIFPESIKRFLKVMCKMCIRDRLGGYIQKNGGKPIILEPNPRLLLLLSLLLLLLLLLLVV